MIDTDAILHKLEDQEWPGIFENLMTRIKEGWDEAFLAVDLESHELQIRDRNSITDQEYILVSICGDLTQTDCQSAAQFAGLGACFGLWQIQLSQINYFSQNPEEFNIADFGKLSGIIKSAGWAGEAADLGHFAVQEAREQPSYEVIDLRNGEIRLALHNTIEPHEFPIFCLLPSENNALAMEAAMNLVRAMNAIKLTAILNLTLLNRTTKPSAA